MALPVLVVVDDEHAALQALTRELESRYGGHYRIASGASPEAALSLLAQLRAGAGVFYGAGTIEAQAVAGKPVYVVGGGNSAGQAAMHLSKYARQVTILVRSRSLAASMSEYLVREIGNAANVTVQYATEVAGGGGDGRLEHLLLRSRVSGETELVPAAGLFVLIGAQPFTDWLPAAVRLDQWGFILTGPDAAPHWPPARPPFLLQTTPPCVRGRRRPAPLGETRRVRRGRGLDRHPPRARIPDTYPHRGQPALSPG